MSRTRVGIYSIAVNLPEQIRTNDWWPKEIVEGWRDRRAAIEGWRERKREKKAQASASEATLTVGMKMATEEMAKLKDDPFMGVKERRIIDEGKRPIDLEIEAAEAALAKAGIDRSEIDLLLENSSTPEDINAPNACLVHRRLGLSPRCFSLSVGAACNSFLMQLAFAENMIGSGQARYGLLVNSCVTSPILHRDLPLSPIFGDGAAATVVGPVGDSSGILGHAHRTDGAFYDVLRLGVPGGSWYDAEPCYLYAKDAMAGYRMLMELGDSAREVVHEALDKAGLQPADVAFYAAHQGTLWFAEVSRVASELVNAQTLSTFSWAGNLSAVNPPLVLHQAETQGMLKDGDLVALHSGGSGITLSGVVLRWGR